MSWVELSKSWYDTSVENCEVCGNLLIGRYWAFESDDGTVMRACREDDQELLGWLNRHRQGNAELFEPEAPAT